VTGPVTHASSPLVFVNGVRMPAEGAQVSARDRGFTLADGLFETMRARRSVVFRLERHLARLSNGLRVMQIPEPPQLRQLIHEALSDGSLAVPEPVDLSVRLTITRGPGAGGLTPPPDLSPTVVVTVTPMARIPPETYTLGLRAIIASGRRNARSITAGLKTLSYTDAVVAWLEAQRAGADEAIFLDEDGHCSEATASNLFVYDAGHLLTPPVTCAALPGITRAAVLELAIADGLRVEERAFGPERFASSDEVFLTSSLRGIAPVRSVGGVTIGSGTVGAVTTRLRAAYTALVDRESSAP
jgi:branched-chain amino acid aminotransferase